MPSHKKKHAQTTRAERLAMVHWLENEQNFAMISGVMLPDGQFPGAGKASYSSKTRGFPVAMAAATASSSTRKMSAGTFVAGTGVEMPTTPFAGAGAVPSPADKRVTKAEGYRQMRAHVNSQTSAQWTVDMTRSRYESYLGMYRKARKILKDMEARLSPAELQREVGAYETKKNDLCPYYDRMDALYGDGTGHAYNAPVAGGVAGLTGTALAAASAARAAAVMAAGSTGFRPTTSTTSPSVLNSQSSVNDEEEDDDMEEDDDSSSAGGTSPHQFVSTSPMFVPMGTHISGVMPSFGAPSKFSLTDSLDKVHQRQQGVPSRTRPGKKRERELLAETSSSRRQINTMGTSRVRKHTKRGHLLENQRDYGDPDALEQRRTMEWELYLQTNRRLGLYQQELEIGKQELYLKQLELKSKEFLQRQEVRAELIASLVKAGRSMEETKQFLSLV